MIQSMFLDIIKTTCMLYVCEYMYICNDNKCQLILNKNHDLRSGQTQNIISNVYNLLKIII